MAIYLRQIRGIANGGDDQLIPALGETLQSESTVVPADRASGRAIEKDADACHWPAAGRVFYNPRKHVILSSCREAERA